MLVLKLLFRILRSIPKFRESKLFFVVVVYEWRKIQINFKKRKCIGYRNLGQEKAFLKM